MHYADSAATLAASEAAGEAPLLFPPPRESAIGEFLEMRSLVRPAAGREVVYSRAGTPEVRSGLLYGDVFVCSFLFFFVFGLSCIVSARLLGWRV